MSLRLQGRLSLDFSIVGRRATSTAFACRIRLLLEARLALFCEYHPHVRSYQRGDMSPAFASAYNIHAPLGTPYRIAYMYEGKDP